MKPQTLAELLGTYQKGKNLYSVRPSDSKFSYRITFGHKGQAPNYVKYCGAVEAYRRINAKLKGGYELIEPHTGYIPDEARMINRLPRTKEQIESDLEFLKSLEKK